MSIAVIKTGGKQYLVKPKDTIKVEKLPNQVGDIVKFDALLVSDEAGKEVKIGQPSSGISVEAKVLDQSKEDKITVIKYKSKVRYRRKAGHRQPFTKIEIQKI
ncbi:MAG: 50S ribosomal protein L21 [Candidatus Buchananbacteria bacterium]|nr:50S ribosomal protein L21 [Candidatus Buchananbacteria bacterium]